MRVLFAAPFLLPETVRFIEAVAALRGVSLGLISQDPADRLPAGLRSRLDAHYRVEDGLDARQLAAAVQRITDYLGWSGGQGTGVQRLIGTLEQLQVPLAQVRSHLGIPGMGVAAARRFRDKALMKRNLAAAGLPVAGHRLVHGPPDEALGWEPVDARDTAAALVAALGLPLVCKPPAGAGARGTFRVSSEAALAGALLRWQPGPGSPLLVEQFVTGQERSFEVMSLGGRPVWHSLTLYEPGPLAVLSDPGLQWTVLLPREVEHPRFDAVRQAGLAALSVLGMDSGLSHMEWFETGDRPVVISEVGARPPGARFMDLISAACEVDFHALWARAVVFEQFEPPTRRYAAGAAYLRGRGRGRRVTAVHGLAEAQRAIGPLVVSARLPQVGQLASSSYEGEGSVILRHPETSVVQRALRLLVDTVRVELG